MLNNKQAEASKEYTSAPVSREALDMRTADLRGKGAIGPGTTMRQAADMLKVSTDEAFNSLGRTR